MSVPPVLLSGHHARVRQWRLRESLRRTLERRPDLLGRARLDADERALLRELTRDSVEEHDHERH
jgi:tRNA (guanine37-N1)-methyltransferase